MVHVHGRLLHAQTGKPLANVRVWALPFDTEPLDEALVDQLTMVEADLERDGTDVNTRAVWLSYPSTVTGADGSFDLAFSAARTRPRQGLASLRIEVPGKPSMLLPVPDGTWERGPESDDAFATFATWNVGDIRLP